MLVQAFRPEASIEGFDVCVVGGLAWSREVEHDATLVSVNRLAKLTPYWSKPLGLDHGVAPT